MRNKAIIGISLVLMQCVIYGFGDPISKAAYESVSVFSLLTVRYWIGFVFLMLIFGRKVIRELRVSDWKLLILPSICIAGTFIVSNVAIGMTSPTSVAFLKSTATVMTPLMALVIFRKHYSLKHVPVLAVIMVGLYLLCTAGGTISPGAGEILGLISAVFGAGSLVFAEGALDKMSAITITTVQTGTSALLASVCAFMSEGGVHMAGASTSVWLTIIYLALACTVCGYLLQNYAMRWISASSVAVLQCIYPVMTAFFSFFIISERLAATGVAGAMIIILCVLAENIISAEEENTQKHGASRKAGRRRIRRAGRTRRAISIR